MTSWKEQHVPLDDVHEVTAGLVDLYGGSVEQTEEQSMTFVLPVRRGVAASGGTRCILTWSGSAGDGEIEMSSEIAEAPRWQRVMLLAVGVTGALLWLLWPFFDELRPLSMIGGIAAFVVYFLASARGASAVSGDFFRRLTGALRGD